MSFLKKQWPLIVFGVVVLGSVGMGAWAIPAGSDVEEKMRTVADVVRKLRSYQNNAANAATIEAIKQQKEEEREEFERLVETALAPQRTNAFYEEVGSRGAAPARETIIPDVLPDPENALRITFKSCYINEFAKLNERLVGRSRATPEQIAREYTLLEQLKSGDDEDTPASGDQWRSRQTREDAKPSEKAEPQSLSAMLREHAESRAAERVAKDIRIYVDDSPNGAFGRHDLANQTNPPDAVQIWQAQMSLWIQQDIAAAIARCNEERVAALREAGRPEDDLWVAYMPVKRLKVLRIQDVLGGQGGGSNAPRAWMESFTKVENNAKRFVVALQLEVVVEEASVMDLLRHITSIGFYTVLGADYKAVKPDPICEEYIYGDEPVVEARIHLEGCFFREVFEQWIPKELKPILKIPGAVSEDKPGGRSR
ncbi:MAG: hypothetical protein ABII12_02440 [Planctomycetota bacterium]